MSESILDFAAVLPILVLTLGVILVLLFDFFLQRTTSGPPRMEGSQYTVVTIAIALSAWVLTLPYLGTLGYSERAFRGLVFIDPFAFVFYSIILFGLATTLLLNAGTLEGQRVKSTVDVNVLLMLSAIGSMVMVSAANLIVIFLAFEILSVAVYALAGIARGEKASSEAALKYFLLGAFSSAFLLYGMTLVYGVTGTMDLVEISTVLAVGGGPSVLLLVGMGLVIFGFAFKTSLVPFHFWAPDVYQGAPTSIVTYMAVVVKAAAFGCFMRIMIMAFGGIAGDWTPILAFVSGATMLVGNLCALRQRSVKRMLAYSSIAHAGYTLLGFVAGDAGGWEAAIFYLVVYSLMTIGSFGVVLVVSLGTKGQYDGDTFDSLRGLGWSRPILGLAMAVAILSLAGIPPLAGFFGKLYLFSAAIRGGFVGLAVFAAINSVISLYYYLRVLVVMYFSADDSVVATPAAMGVPLSSRLALTLATIGTLTVGVLSSEVVGFSRSAVAGVRGERVLHATLARKVPRKQTIVSSREMSPAAR